MKSKFIALVAAAALAAMLGLAGCGGQQAASSSTAAESSSAAAESSSAAVESSSAAVEQSASAAAADATYVGEDVAKEAALKAAGLAEADVTELEVELDTDDAVIHYDVDFKAGGQEYDYKIDATTGEVLNSEVEIDD